MALKIIVIGSGFGKQAVAPCFSSLGCDVELVSARDEAAIRKAVSSGVDLVSIHSPPFMHLQHVRLAIEYGCNVLCDKPFGLNAAEAETMCELAREAGILNFVNFEFRFDPLRQRLKALLDEGTIGQVLHTSNSMYLSRGRKLPHGWLFEKDKGGGWIGAYASHIIDELHWLFGDIEQLSALPRIDLPFRKSADDSGQEFAATAEDAVTAWFRMQNGVTAALDTAFASAVDLPMQACVLGSEGSIRISHGTELVLHKPGQEAQHFAQPRDATKPIPALYHWLDKVCEALLSQSALAPDFSDGLKCRRVLDQMLHSS